MAQQIPGGTETVDAIITDPPYYDSVPYSTGDFFYVWLKRILGDQYQSVLSYST